MCACHVSLDKTLAEFRDSHVPDTLGWSASGCRLEGVVKYAIYSLPHELTHRHWAILCGDMQHAPGTAAHTRQGVHHQTTANNQLSLHEPAHGEGCMHAVDTVCPSSYPSSCPFSCRLTCPSSCQHLALQLQTHPEFLTHVLTPLLGLFKGKLHSSRPCSMLRSAWPLGRVYSPCQERGPR